MTDQQIPKEYWKCLSPLKQIQLAYEERTGQPLVFASEQTRELFVLLLDRIVALEKQVKNHSSSHPWPKDSHARSD